MALQCGTLLQKYVYEVIWIAHINMCVYGIEKTVAFCFDNVSAIIIIIITGA